MASSVSPASSSSLTCVVGRGGGRLGPGRGHEDEETRKKKEVKIQGAPENLRDWDGRARNVVLVRGHICEAGSRVEARQKRDTAFSVGRQEANTSTTRPTTFNLLGVCLGYLNRVTVSGVTRIQLICLAQAHPTWHPPGRRPLPFVATTSILAPPSPTPHHHSHSIAAPGSEARGIPPKVSNSDLPTVAMAPRHLETLTLATVNACNQPPRAAPLDQCKRRQWLERR